MASNMKKSLLKNLLFSAIGFVVILLIWQICAKVYNKPLILPGVGSTIKQFALLFTTKQFYVDTLLTFLRSIAAFTLAFALAFVLATAAVTSNKLYHALKPAVSILATTPIMAVLLLLLVFVKSMFLPIVVAFLMTFPVLYTAIYTQFSSAEQKFGNMCKVYKVGFFNKLFSVWLPSSLNALLNCCKTTLSMSVKVTISGEVLAYTANSLGNAMQEAANSYSLGTEKLLAYCFVALLLSMLAELLVWAVQKLLKGAKLWH